MSEVIVGTAHFPWLIPRLIIGFFVVFMLAPIFASLLTPLFSANSTFVPITMFTDYWKLLAGNPGLASVAVLFSIVTGAVFGELLYDVQRVIRDGFSAIRSRIWKQSIESSRHKRLDGYNNAMQDVGFQIWMLSYRDGAPGKFFDWNGLLQSLQNWTAIGTGYLLLSWGIWLLGWVIYRAVNVLPVWGSNSFNEQVVGMSILFVFIWATSFYRARLGQDQLQDVVIRLHDDFKPKTEPVKLYVDAKITDRDDVEKQKRVFVAYTTEDGKEKGFDEILDDDAKQTDSAELNGIHFAIVRLGGKGQQYTLYAITNPLLRNYSNKSRNSLRRRGQ